MEKIRDYIARTGLASRSRDVFVKQYSSGPPLLMSVRGQSGEETARVMTLVMSPSDAKKQGNPLDRFIYPLEKVDTRNSFAMWVTLGRAPNNDLILPNPAVSKFHATFRKVGGDYFVCDRGSTNGTALLRGDLRDRLHANVERRLEDRCTLEFGAENGEVLMYLGSPASVYDVLSQLNGK